MKYGLIAGNGRFPILVLEAARRLGHEMVTVAIQEEAAPEVETLSPACHWVSLGELSRVIDIFQRAGVHQLIFAGQVKHAQIFSSIRPDWRLFKLLASLRHKNTSSLIGAIMKVFADEGLEVIDSTLLLKPYLAEEGVLTRRRPSKDEQGEISYGRRIAHALAGFDVGQSVVICDRACVAVEAMEGTDAILRRAAALCNGRPLRLIKSSRRREHLLYDVPVAGISTIPVMVETGTTVLAIDAGRTLLLDREQMLRDADAAGIAIVAFAPET